MLTKYRIFKIEINEFEGEYNIENKAFDVINEFLSDANIVYLNHATSVLGKDLSRATGAYRDQYLLVSLVYKDLSETPNQLKNVSKKSQRIVKTAIEKGDDLPKPNYITAFDKTLDK